MTQLALDTEPPLRFWSRCIRCGAVLDVMLEEEAVSGRPLNEAVLWGAVARAEHRCEEATMAKYLLELGVQAEAADEREAERIAQVALQAIDIARHRKVRRWTPDERALLDRITDATVSNIDGEFLR